MATKDQMIALVQNIRDNRIRLLEHGSADGYYNYLKPSIEILDAVLVELQRDHPPRPADRYRVYDSAHMRSVPVDALGNLCAQPLPPSPTLTIESEMEYTNHLGIWWSRPSGRVWMLYDGRPVTKATFIEAVKRFHPDRVGWGDYIDPSQVLMTKPPGEKP